MIVEIDPRFTRAEQQIHLYQVLPSLESADEWLVIKRDGSGVYTTRESGECNCKAGQNGLLCKHLDMIEIEKASRRLQAMEDDLYFIDTPASVAGEMRDAQESDVLARAEEAAWSRFEVTEIEREHEAIQADFARRARCAARISSDFPD